MRERKSLPVVTVRLNADSKLKSDKAICNASDAIEIIKNELQDYAREAVMCLYMDNRNHPVAIGMISAGSINGSLVSPFQVLQTALLSNAPNLILFHNHPSGNVMPSDEDVRVTKQVAYAASLMGCVLLDHIIIGSNGDALSMKNGDILDFTEMQHEKIDEQYKQIASLVTDNLKNNITNAIENFDNWLINR